MPGGGASTGGWVGGGGVLWGLSKNRQEEGRNEGEEIHGGFQVRERGGMEEWKEGVIREEEQVVRGEEGEGSPPEVAWETAVTPSPPDQWSN